MRGYPRHHASSAPSDRSTFGRGFTLVELMITIALVAILVAVTLPAMSRTMQRIDARSTARSVANVFRRARDQAMSRGEVILVEINQNQDRGELILYRSNDRALRCNGLDTNNVTEVGDRTHVDHLSGDMVLRGIATRQSGGSPDWLCFSPEGTVRDPAGDIIHHGTCAGVNFRMWVARENANLQQAAQTAGVSAGDLTGCPGSGSSWSKSKRRKVRNGRYLTSLWLIEVPYNGSIRAYQ